MHVASDYNTISMEVIYVIAGMIAIGVILAKDSKYYQQRVVNGHAPSVVRSAAKAISIIKWS